METGTSIVFPPFRLDVNSEQLWREEEAIPLRPKTFAVLRYLVEHPGQLVTKDELLDAVWVGTVVSDTVLKSCIRELREALGDNVQTPRFIATVHRHGYRWVASLSTTPPPFSLASRVQRLASQDQTPRPHTVRTLDPRRPTRDVPLVGREADLTQLHSWLDKALRGERQLVFVTGEPGIGKTTLVDAFLQTLDSRRPTRDGGLWLGWGQCIEQYGAGEPYMPILEALGRLCREPGGDRLIALLHQRAPTWLVQMPTLLDASELETLQRKVQGATRERMLREMAEAIDAITAERPLVLWLEDLHWSDPSTLELLSLLARRREPARLLIVGTYRPVDVIVSEHPLRTVKQELQLHGHCQELPVRLLTEVAVAEYLAVKMDATGGTQHPVPLQRVAHAIHERTEGNPLFMVNVVEELRTQETVDHAAVERSTPATIRQMIERQFDRISSEEQRVLEAASVAGMEFSAAAVAAGAAVAVDEIEECCAGLARRGQFLQTRGTAEWPDGTLATRYSFLHALHREVTYERVPVGRRARLHQHIGERMEIAYGTQASEIAAELAVHFERGRDYGRATQYLRQAGENANRRSAHQEAVILLTKGLELLKTLSNTPERVQQELQLLTTLGPALFSLKGTTAPEVEQTYARAYALCQQSESPDQLIEVLAGLRVFHLVRGEVRKAREVAEQRLWLAQRVAPPTALVLAHAGLGETLSYLGEFMAAREHLEHAWRRYRTPEHNRNDIRNWGYTGVLVFSRLAETLCVLGYPDQARQEFERSLALAETPFSLAIVWCVAGWLHAFHREWLHVREQAEAVITLATEQGFPYWLAYGTGLRGRALAEQGQVEEGIALLQQGLASFQTVGAELARIDLLPCLATAYAKAGRVEEGLAVLTEALTLVNNTGACSWEAEIYRLKGELLLQMGRH